MPSMDSILMQRKREVQQNPGLLYGSAFRTETPAPALSHRLLRGFAVLELRHDPRDPEAFPAVPLAEFDGLAEEFRSALERFCSEPVEACWRCGTPVGLVGEPLPAPGLSAAPGPRWEFVALVSRAGEGPVSVQCEACAPDVAPEPWPAGQPQSVLAGELVECRAAADGVRMVHVTTPGGTGCRCGALAPVGPPVVATRQG